MGTASDRYAGWTGQIYSPERYDDRIIRRRKSVGGRSFEEIVLPVDSVAEYFEHFSVLEIDFTFYRTLLDTSGQPTQNYHLLRNYKQHLREEDLLLLKVPQAVFAQKVRSGGKFVDNEFYLDPDIFTNQFYKPAVDILGSVLSGFIFEQAYQRKKERPQPEELAEALDRFFGTIPQDNRYHVELRTESLLNYPYFSILEKHGVGQVLSHWTWLPTLLEQFSKSGKRFFNSGKRCVLRLITPRGMRYEDTYIKAHPFDKIVDDLFGDQMIEEAAELMWAAIEHGVTVDVIVNNRAGGNAPLIAKRISERFQAMSSR
jgi:uncharacterized protein YecE (DUF72 family)